MQYLQKLIEAEQMYMINCPIKTTSFYFLPMLRGRQGWLTPMNLLLSNLATADLFVTFLMMPIEVILKNLSIVLNI